MFIAEYQRNDALFGWDQAMDLPFAPERITYKFQMQGIGSQLVTPKEMGVCGDSWNQGLL